MLCTSSFARVRGTAAWAALAINARETTERWAGCVVNSIFVTLEVGRETVHDTPINKKFQEQVLGIFN